MILFKCFFYCLYKWLIELTSNCFFAIQSVLSINMKSPIRKLLVLTNQSSSGSLIYFAYKCNDNQRTKCANIVIRSAGLYVCKNWFLYFYFQSKSRFHGRSSQTCKKACGRWGRTWWYETDSILNWKNLLKAVLID